ELELGDAVPQQSTDAIGPFEHGHRVARAIELRCCGKSRWSRSNDGHASTGSSFRRLRGDPAFLERAIDDRHLDGFDRDRIVVDAEHARALARGRAESAGEFRKVVGGVQPIDGRLPALPIDEIVPVRDQISQRAAAVAERDPAVHAASRLLTQSIFWKREIDLVPVLHALADRSGRMLVALDFDEPSNLTHWTLRP